MEVTFVHILEHLLSSYVMVVAWFSVIAVSIYITYKIKVYGVLVIAGGAIPFFIFYSYKVFGIWDTRPHDAILYSRIAGISLCVSLILSLWMMHRSIYDESKRLSDS